MSDCRCGKPTRDAAYVCEDCCDRPTQRPAPSTDVAGLAARARVLLHSPTGQKETE